MAQKDPRIKGLFFSRNFGKEAALTAGFDYATGDAVIPIDADLQDPPELISAMLEKWHQGYDIVLATRTKTEQQSRIKAFLIGSYYKIFSAACSINMPGHTGDFRLLDKKVVMEIRRLRESSRFMKGIMAWVGFESCQIFFERPPRKHGSTKWKFRKLWNFAFDGLCSFSHYPLNAGFISAQSLCWVDWRVP